MKNLHPIRTRPIRDILCWLGDRWPMLVLVALNADGTIRFSDIHKATDDILQRMLTVMLRTLETNGLVQRKAYVEVPPRMKYCLTETGCSPIPYVEVLVGWALDHMTVILERREGERK